MQIKKIKTPFPLLLSPATPSPLGVKLSHSSFQLSVLLPSMCADLLDRECYQVHRVHFIYMRGMVVRGSPLPVPRSSKRVVVTGWLPVAMQLRLCASDEMGLPSRSGLVRRDSGIPLVEVERWRELGPNEGRTPYLVLALIPWSQGCSVLRYGLV